MSKCELSIQLDRADPTYRAGETVRGHVFVSTDEAVKCRSLTVTVQWRTHGRGNRCCGTPISVSLFEGDWPAGHEESYAFELPAPTSPATYHGEVLNVDHYLTARADVPWSIDPKAEVELLVPAVDAPEYDFGSKYRPPEAEIRSAATGSNIASVMLAGCFGLPGAAMVLGAMGLLARYFTVHGDTLFPGIFLFLFGGTFALVGFGTAFLLQKRRLAQRRLGAPLTQITPNPVRQGGRVSVQVLAEPPKALELEDGKIRLVGRESVVSGSGTNRTTHGHTVFEHEQVLPMAGRRIEAGETLSIQETLTVPTDAAPTFVGDDNELKWTISVRIGIKGWPDWEQEFPLTVRPR